MTDTWFVALALPAEVVTDLDEALQPVRAARPALRWTPPGRWHLTLAFLGRVGTVPLDVLGARLARAAARHPAPELRLRAGGAFSRAAAARVLWAGVAGEREGLAALARSVLAGARRAGVPGLDEPGSYRPHVTLARARTPTDLRDLVAGLRDYEGPPWVPGEVLLVRSHLGADPYYEQLASWPLAPGVPA